MAEWRCFSSIFAKNRNFLASAHALSRGQGLLYRLRNIKTGALRRALWGMK
jgi:hypothetical protein